MKKTLSAILKAAQAHDINPIIVYAICKQESAFNALSLRYEPGYRWLWKPKEVKPRWCSLATEITLQKTSIGLMQVMGAVYREYGFTGWLSKAIANPETQLEYGCKHLGRKIARYGIDGGIAAYNAGSPRYTQGGDYVNQYYVDNVLKYATQAETGNVFNAV